MLGFPNIADGKKLMSEPKTVAEIRETILKDVPRISDFGYRGLKKYYIFLAFKSANYRINALIESKLFTDFDKMKDYSAEYGAENKPKHKNYCSTYTQIEI